MKKTCFAMALMAGGLLASCTSQPKVTPAIPADSEIEQKVEELLCGLVTFFVVIICSVQKKYKMMKLIPFIIGIGAGYALATIFTGIGIATGVEYLQIINWQPLIDNFSTVTVQSFLNYPDFALIEAIKEMVTGESTIKGAQILNGAGVAEAALAFLPVALVVFAEHIADHKNLSSIIDKDLVEGEPGLKRTLLGDGVGSIAGRNSSAYNRNKSRH